MPTQQGIVLTQARVRVPSPTGLFVMHTLAGLAGVVTVVGVAEGLRRATRLSPGVRAGLTLGAGVIGGALVGRTSPRIGAGLTIGGMAAAAPAAIEAIETAAAVRDAAPSLEARSEPVTSSPPATTTNVVEPSRGLPAQGSDGFAMQSPRSMVHQPMVRRGLFHR